jgi:ribosomal protein S18 acetylase RimI-like enzyme
MARQIHGVLMPAYAQEAQLLRVRHFAPLGRTVADIQAGADCYLGALEQGALVGALSFAPDDELGQFIVNALVVHPEQQRRGFGRALLVEALRLGHGHAFAVATGADNTPALALYRSLGFVEYRRGSLGPEALAMVKLRRAVNA